MSIDTLHPNLSTENRALVAMGSLKAALSELEVMRESVAVQRCLPELEEADTRISLLLVKLRMGTTLRHLAGVMGRAP